MKDTLYIVNMVSRFDHKTYKDTYCSYEEAMNKVNALGENNFVFGRVYITTEKVIFA